MRWPRWISFRRRVREEQLSSMEELVARWRESMDRLDEKLASLARSVEEDDDD